MRAILMYHSVDPSGSPISLDGGCFERHVRFLAEARGAGRLDVVPLAELQAGEPGRHRVAITFDDAFENFGDEAWPRLRDAGLPATVFVVSGHVGGDNRWGGREDEGIPVLPLLGWERLAALAEEGVELGCHTRSHPNLARLDPDRIADEVGGATDAIEAETGVRPRSFAYPFGRHGEAARRIAAETFERSVTTELAVVPEGADPHRLPRLDAWYYQAPGRLESFGSFGFRTHLALRAGARRLREAVRPHGEP